MTKNYGIVCLRAAAGGIDFDLRGPHITTCLTRLDSQIRRYTPQDPYCKTYHIPRDFSGALLHFLVSQVDYGRNHLIFSGEHSAIELGKKIKNSWFTGNVAKRAKFAMV